MNSISIPYDRGPVVSACEHRSESLVCVKGGAFMNYLNDYYSMNVDCVRCENTFCLQLGRRE